jgi:hypothetical protein
MNTIKKLLIWLAVIAPLILLSYARVVLAQG